MPVAIKESRNWTHDVSSSVCMGQGVEVSQGIFIYEAAHVTAASKGKSKTFLLLLRLSLLLTIPPAAANASSITTTPASTTITVSECPCC